MIFFGRSLLLTSSKKISKISEQRAKLSIYIEMPKINNSPVFLEIFPREDFFLPGPKKK
jgi:hypothetical protein